MSLDESAAAALARGIATEFRRRLQVEYVPRISQCVARLGETRLWQRPAANCNSVGNLLLHLRGNVTQWILTGLGNRPDHRQRSGEFAAESGPSGSELCADLAATVAQACELVDTLTVDELLAPCTIQGYAETGLSAILHVLEHCSGHAGQIYAWTKQVTGDDLHFYDL